MAIHDRARKHGGIAADRAEEAAETPVFDNPLAITCPGCGAPARFSIVARNYACAYCGRETGIDAPARRLREFRERQAALARNDGARSRFHAYQCPGCGARVVQDATEATSECAFCGRQLVNVRFYDSTDFPETIIPFNLTPEEARARLEAWVKENRRRPEARLLAARLEELRGFYLPYQVVKGPVRCTVQRSRSTRIYECGGFVNEVAVNASGQLDNLLLEAMEPFDWRELRPFSYGIIAGQHTKLQDIRADEVQARACREVEEAYLPEISRAMQTRDLTVRARIMEALQVPALLPAYIIHSKDVQAVVNGQTGRVAVKPLRETTVHRWWVEPLLSTILVFAACQAAFWWADGMGPFRPEFVLSSLITVIAGVIAFAFAAGSQTVRRTMYLHGPKQLLRRRGTTLEQADASELVENPTLHPVFFEDAGAGAVPVRIRFFTAGRVFRWGLAVLCITFLPCITSVLYVGYDILVYGDPPDFLKEIEFSYGAAWWTLFVPVLYILWHAVLRRDVYDHPLVWRIEPGGGETFIPAGNGISLSRMLGLCLSSPFNWALCFIIFMLLGTTGAMTSF